MRASRAADDLAIKNILNGNEDGYAELYEKYQKPLRKHLKKFMTKLFLEITPEDLDDRTIEALVKLFEVIKSGDYDSTYPIWPLLKKIVENATLNYWHKHYRRTIHYPTAGGLANDEEFIALGIKENDPIPFDMIPKKLYDIYFGPTHAAKPKFDGRNKALDLIQEQEEHHITAFLAQLSPTDYDLFNLFYYEDKTAKEIAEIRNISEGAIFTRLSRARTKYREKYPDRDIPPVK